MAEERTPEEQIALLRRYVNAAEVCRPLVDPAFASRDRMTAWYAAAVALHHAGEIDLGYDPDDEGNDW